MVLCNTVGMQCVWVPAEKGDMLSHSTSVCHLFLFQLVIGKCYFEVIINTVRWYFLIGCGQLVDFSMEISNWVSCMC